MKNIKRVAVMAMLMAIAIVASILESFIPVFVPGVKIGLANVVILYMLYRFKWYEGLVVDLLRVILVALLRGTFLGPTFVMSISGACLSFIVMLIFVKLKFFHVVGVSVLGALFHATGQVIAAIAITSLDAVIYYLPFIGLLSIVTGIFSGIICNALLKRTNLEVLMQ